MSIKSVALAGTAGPTTMLERERGEAVDVAAADDGGVGVAIGTMPTDASYAVHLVRLDADLSSAVFSGILTGRAMEPAETRRQPVAWTGSSYAVAWIACSSCAYPDFHWDNLCVASFTPAGELERAPVCNPLGAGVDPNGNVATSAGDDGMLAALEGPSDSTHPTVLHAARLDAAGTMLPTSPRLLTDPARDVLDMYSPFDVAWDGNGFGVLWGVEPPYVPRSLALYFRFLRAVPSP